MTPSHSTRRTRPVRGRQRPARTYTCSWCGQEGHGTELVCAACGAPVDVRAIAGQSRWYKLPGMPDMAKFQLGDSSCQIEGKYVPVADMNLARGDSVYFSHYLLLWKDPQVTMRLLKRPGYAGISMITAQAEGPGRIAFSRDAPGELCALTLQPGQATDVTEDGFMLATGNVRYELFSTNIWFTTKKMLSSEVFYPMGRLITRFQAHDKPGLVLLHGSGNVFLRELAAKEIILVQPGALLCKDATVSMQLHFEEPRGNIINSPLGNNGFWNQRTIWLQMSGPGRVAIQSAFAPTEDDGYPIRKSSAASSKSW